MNDMQKAFQEYTKSEEFRDEMAVHKFFDDPEGAMWGAFIKGTQQKITTVINKMDDIQTAETKYAIENNKEYTSFRAMWNDLREWLELIEGSF